MPFPDEHACRLIPPDDCQASSFRRVNGEREHECKKYDVIMAKKKGEDAMKHQAFRYPKDDWTAAFAKTHCKDHDGTFEAASGGDDMDGDDMDMRRLRKRGLQAKAGQRVWFEVNE